MRGKNFIKRILYFTLILSILASVLNLSSCDRKYDEEEVRVAAEQLLKESEVLNLVLWGKGIATVTSNYQTGVYYEADFLHLNELGFTTVAELKDMVSNTFTVEYSELVFSTVLSPISVDGVAYSNTRYYQNYYDEINKTDPVCIMVYRDYDYLFKDSVVYDYSTIRVTDVKKQTLYVTVDAAVTNADGESQQREIVFELIEQSDGWRINSPTYVNYNAYADRYDDLKDQDIK